MKLSLVETEELKKYEKSVNQIHTLVRSIIIIKLIIAAVIEVNNFACPFMKYPKPP